MKIFKKSRMFSGLMMICMVILYSAVFNSCSSADPVILPPPAPSSDPPPAAPELAKVPEKIISYTVEPSAPYKDIYGYISLEYKTREEIWEKIKSLLDKKASSADEYDKALFRLPEYGKLIINIGRQDLMHANTRWYEYQAYLQTPYNLKTKLFSIRGEEGIPNVKGRDGNWWNIVEIPLKEEITSSLELTVRDNKTGSDFVFTVTRVETDA